MFDGEQFGKDLVVLVKGYMEREVAPLRAENEALRERLVALENLNTEAGAQAEKFAREFGDTLGKMVAEAIEAIEIPEAKGVESEALEAAVSAAVAALPAPQDGKSVTIEELAPVIKEQVDAAVEAIELPEPKSVDEDALERLVKATVTAEIEALPKPQDGKSVELDDLRPVVTEEVERAVSAIPVPKDGEPGKDGLNVKNMLIDKDGHLRCIMADGTDHKLGLVVGKDGEPGAPGLGFEDLDVQVLDDDRTIELSFRRGEEEKAFTVKWPTVIDRGVFKGEREYAAGDGVTWAGSYWIAQRDTSDKPDAPESGWRLAVKKGRDGKNAGKGTE